MKKLLYLALLLPLCIVSCNEDEIMTFDDETAGIYFQNGGQTRFYINIDQYYDSTFFTFSQSADAVTDTVLYTRLRTMGKVRDYDRKVRVVVDKEFTTAIEGTHFRVDLDNIFIPAGESEVRVPVTLLRDKSLLEQEVQLMLKVEDNENFYVPFERQKNTNVYYDSGDTIRANRYLFVFNEFYSEPVIWSMFLYGYPDGVNPCGAWSRTKQRLMSQLFNLTEDDWDYTKGWANGKGVQYQSFIYYAVKMQVYLQQMADAGTPVIDDDGSYMQLGPGHEVDYSAYM